MVKIRSSISIVYLGPEYLLSKLGKKGTVSDICFYNYKKEDLTVSFITPVKYPDRVQSLLYAMTLGDTVILNIPAMDGALGEEIIAIDLLNKTDGFITTLSQLDPDIFNSEEGKKYQYIDAANIDKISRDHLIAGYRKLNKIDDLYKWMDTYSPKPSDINQPYMAIDHSFMVKGVGTVILSILRDGNIKVHDTMMLYPSKKIVEIKSIQVHDINREEAYSSERVGIAFKGLNIDEVERGNIVAMPDSLSIADKVTGTFHLNPFYKKTVNAGMHATLYINMQSVPCVVTNLSDSSIDLELGKKITYKEGWTGLLLTLDSKLPRIAGKVKM